MIDDVTELARAQIKKYLMDTSSIVRPVQPPRKRPHLREAKRLRSLEERIKLPNQRNLAPELLDMFSWTMRDDPLPFRLRHGYNHTGPIHTSANSLLSLSLDKVGTDAVESDDVEFARDGDPSFDAGGFNSIHDEFGIGEDDDDMQQEDQQRDEFAFPYELPSDHGDQMLLSKDNDTDGGGSGDESVLGLFSAVNRTGPLLADAGQFELGAVNDLQDMADNHADASPSRSQGKSAASFSLSVENGYDSRVTATNLQRQWHPHTVKVMAMLRSQFEEHDDGNRLDVSGKVGVEPKTSYKYITGASGGKKVGRRTAAGVFFEMLQLKTWDYIHVVQDAPYSDITVSKAAQFHTDTESKPAKVPC